MKNKIFVSVFILFFMLTTSSYAQFNPYSDNRKMVTVGVGASGWGIPLFVRYEQPVADNITVGGDLSYQSKSEKYGPYKWNHTIVGINGRGSYHFNELLNAPNEWDFYAGATLGYYIWNTKYDGNGIFDYTGSGNGGFSLGAHVGARYFVNDNLAITGEVGGGSVLAGGTVGVTFLF